jgi:hypothetical protein
MVPRRGESFEERQLLATTLTIANGRRKEFEHNGLQIWVCAGFEGAEVSVLPDERAECGDEVCDTFMDGRTAARGKDARELGADGLRIKEANADVNPDYRSFIQRSYPTMKKHNPHTPIMIREASGTEPKVYARFGAFEPYTGCDADGC